MASSSASTPTSTTIPSSTSKKMRKNVSGAMTDVGWEHGIDMRDRKVKCKYCDNVYTGVIFRFKLDLFSYLLYTLFSYLLYISYNRYLIMYILSICT